MDTSGRFPPGLSRTSGQRARPAHSRPGPHWCPDSWRASCGKTGVGGAGSARHTLVAGAGAGARPPGLHYFGWCRPRPHPAGPALRAAGGSRSTSDQGRLASAAMSSRSVPHAHPATAEYEFANPSRLGEQRFGEGMAQASYPHPEILGWPPEGAGLHPPRA